MSENRSTIEQILKDHIHAEAEVKEFVTDGPEWKVLQCLVSYYELCDFGYDEATLNGLRETCSGDVYDHYYMLKLLSDEGKIELK
jgi:hypothetical protein